MSILQSTHKNKQSIIFESNFLRAEFVPQPGGKLVSLTNKSVDREYLTQRDGDVYRDQPYDGNYLKGELCGFDDMFPTIDKCYYGDTFTWPELTTADGKKYRADISKPKTEKDGEKYYFKNKLKEGWCGLQYPDGAVLKFLFPEEKVPYLGILMNQSAWNDQYNIFIEPCTGTFGRIDLAKIHNQCSKIKVNSDYLWYLDINVKNN